MNRNRSGYRPAHAVVASHIPGGFVPVRAADLLVAWRLYVSGEMQLRDLRLWLAALELRAQSRFRRRRLGDSELGEHLKSIAGDQRSAVRAARQLRRFEARVKAEDVPSSTYLKNLRRRVPVPRRLVTELARSGSRASIASAVGHLLRCMYWRGGSVVSGGTAKAALLAESLGVSLRTIRRGRHELLSRGWLESVPVSQNVLNRHGSVMRVSSGAAATSQMARPPAVKRRDLAPPKNRDQLRCLLRTRTDHERGQDGDRLSFAHADTVYRRLTASGRIQASDAMRLAVLSCAAYAARCASRSPIGLFRYLVNKRLWTRPTCGDEDRAAGWLRGSDETERRGLESVEDVATRVIKRLATFPTRLQQNPHNGDGTRRFAVP